jgi:hypothetical protein
LPMGRPTAEFPSSFWLARCLVTVCSLQWQSEPLLVFRVSQPIFALLKSISFAFFRITWHSSTVVDRVRRCSRERVDGSVRETVRSADSYAKVTRARSCSM